VVFDVSDNKSRALTPVIRIAKEGGGGVSTGRIETKEYAISSAPIVEMFVAKVNLFSPGAMVRVGLIQAFQLDEVRKLPEFS
jgi:hypothetical protein